MQWLHLIWSQMLHFYMQRARTKARHKKGGVCIFHHIHSHSLSLTKNLVKSSAWQRLSNFTKPQILQKKTYIQGQRLKLYTNHMTKELATATLGGVENLAQVENNWILLFKLGTLCKKKHKCSPCHCWPRVPFSQAVCVGENCLGVKI